MAHRELTTEETEALQAFANAHKSRAVLDRLGVSNWKDALSMVYWYNARIWRNGENDAPQYGTILHGIRNEFGPSWLYDECKIKPL